MPSIASRLKYAMELRGLKQSDIVERTGINKGAISSYISGRYSPKQNNLYLLAKVLDVSEAWLMGADVPMERTKDSAPAASVEEPAYYLNEETARIAQEVFDDPDLRMLFSASRNARPEDIRLAAEMLRRFKETNPDG